MSVGEGGRSPDSGVREAVGAGVFFSDLSVGWRFVTRERTVTESEVVGYAQIVEGFHPLHVDEDYARSTRFGRRIVHGPLGLGIALALAGGVIGDGMIALLSIGGWRWDRPLFLESPFRVEVEVTSMRRRDGRNDGVVTFATRLVDAGAEVLQEGDFDALMAVTKPQKGSAG